MTRMIEFAIPWTWWSLEQCSCLHGFIFCSTSVSSISFNTGNPWCILKIGVVVYGRRCICLIAFARVYLVLQTHPPSHSHPLEYRLSIKCIAFSFFLVYWCSIMLRSLSSQVRNLCKLRLTNVTVKSELHSNVRLERTYDFFPDALKQW